MDEFETIKKSSVSLDVPIIVDFTASWCKPCKKIAPFFEALSESYDAIFVKVDVDELDELATECKVSMMPTFVAFRGGEIVDSTAGAQEESLELLVKKISSKLV